MEKAILQFCSFFKSEVKSVTVYCGVEGVCYQMELATVRLACIQNYLYSDVLSLKENFLIFKIRTRIVPTKENFFVLLSMIIHHKMRGVGF